MEAELKDALERMPTWRQEGGKLVRDYAFPNFVEALAFVNQLGTLAEQQNHHPDIDIRYNRIRLGLITHDVDGVTNRDVKLAMLIDAM